MPAASDSYFLQIENTAVAPGTVGTVPTVPLFLSGTANRTTIWTENNNLEMKKGYYLLMSLQ
jgi:hypothetical protein